MCLTKFLARSAERVHSVSQRAVMMNGSLGTPSLRHSAWFIEGSKRTQIPQMTQTAADQTVSPRDVHSYQQLWLRGFINPRSSAFRCCFRPRYERPNMYC